MVRAHRWFCRTVVDVPAKSLRHLSGQAWCSLARPSTITGGMGRQLEVEEERRPLRRRRRLWVAIALLISLLGLVVTVAAALAWLRYAEFAGQVNDANRRLDNTIALDLGSSPSRDDPSVVLIAGPQMGLDGAVLLRIDPRANAASVVALLRGTKLGAAQVGPLVKRDDIPSVLTALQQSGVTVNHVVLLTGASLQQTVDSLGGITVPNPESVEISSGSGTTTVGRGEIDMTGAVAERYATAQLPPSLSMSRGARQARVLAAIGAQLLLPTKTSTLSKIGPTLSSSVATDLTPQELVAYASERTQLSTSVRCVAYKTLSPSMVGRFLGGTQSVSFCRPHRLDKAVSGLEATVIAAAGRNIERLLLTVFLVSLAIATAGILLVILTSAPVRELFARRDVLPGPSEQVTASAAVPAAAAAPARVVPWQADEPRAPGRLGRGASRLRALPHSIAAGVRVPQWRLRRRKPRRSESRPVSTGHRRPMPRPWAAVTERIEEHRERAALRPFGGRGIRDHVSSLRERVEDRRYRRREAVEGRAWSERAHLPFREAAVETGSPSRVSYIAAGVMVVAAVAALLVVLLGV